MSNNNSSNIVDKTFVELLVVLLFTAFVIYVVIEQYTSEQSKAISESIVSSIEVDYRQCQRRNGSQSTVLLPDYADSKILLENFFFKTREFDSLSNISSSDQRCIETICVGLIRSLFAHRDLISRVDIEGYASPGHTGTFSRLGRACQNSAECNVVFSSDRASNVYQICSSAIKNEPSEIVSWFQSSFFPIGKGVPESASRYRNIEFSIEYNELIQSALD